MGRLDPSIPGYKLRQTGAEIQSILDAVSLLSGNEVKQLRELIDDIRDMDSTDNDDDLGAQLINGMVKKKDVQQTVNDNTTYPPTSGAVKSAIDTHKNKAELDHPQSSVKEHHLANNIISSSKIKEGAVGKAKLSQDVKAMLDNAYDKVKLDSYISTLSKAPKHCLSDLNRHSSSEDFYFDLDNIVSSIDQYFILKNDTGYDFSASNPIWYNVDYGWYPDKSLLSGKTYLCIFRDFIDTGDGVIQNGTFDVVCEMGSDIIDLMTTSKGWNGTWKYGTELTHTSGQVSSDEISNVKAGDFYLNSETYSVYHTDNGTHWLYVGNLNGGIDGLDSPKFTGEPKAPTPAVTNNSNQLATTEFVRNAIDTYSGSNSTGGTTGIKTFKLSECSTFIGQDGLYTTPDVAIGQIFLLKNDTNESFNYFTQHDEYGNCLSEPIPAGETRVCVITDLCYGGAEVHNGYVWVLPVGGASISSLLSEITALKNRVKALEDNA